MKKLHVLAVVTVCITSSPAFGVPIRAPDGDQQRMDPIVANCIIQRRPKFVQSWLGTLAGSSAEKKLVRPMESDFPACFNGGPWTPMGWASTFNYQGMREGLIAILLKPRLSGLPPTAPAGLANASWYPKEQADGAGALAAALANDLGFCIARTDWTSTRSLVASERGSEIERAAIGKLIRQVGGCLPPGQKLVLDRARLRSILTETVYHAIAASGSD